MIPMVTATRPFSDHTIPLKMTRRFDPLLSVTLLQLWRDEEESRGYRSPWQTAGPAAAAAIAGEVPGDVFSERIMARALNVSAGPDRARPRRILDRAIDPKNAPERAPTMATIMSIRRDRLRSVRTACPTV